MTVFFTQIFRPDPFTFPTNRIPNALTKRSTAPFRFNFPVENMKSDVLHKNCSRKKSLCNNSLQVKTYQLALLNSERDDRARIWIHKEFSEGLGIQCQTSEPGRVRAGLANGAGMRSEAREYGLYFPLKKISCGPKDQARARPSGEKCRRLV